MAKKMTTPAKTSRTHYPNSACELHKDVSTSEPVCIICLKNEIERSSAEKTDTCEWRHDDDAYYENDSPWETECGDAVIFDEGTPEEHGYKFCHYCGKPIEYVRVSIFDDAVSDV